MKGHLGVVNLLIANGAEVNVNTKDSPLFNAILFNHKEIVEVLIKNQADVNAKILGDKTPLSIAIDNNYSEIADLLRKHGAKE